MFSLFPSLLGLEGLAPFFLRLTLGAVFIYWGYIILKKRDQSGKKRAGASLEILIGISCILGYLTQLGSLLALIVLGSRLITKVRAKAFLTDGINYYLVLFVIALSLLFTGPGAWAFDLPL